MIVIMQISSLAQVNIVGKLQPEKGHRRGTSKLMHIIVILCDIVSDLTKPLCACGRFHD